MKFTNIDNLDLRKLDFTLKVKSSLTYLCLIVLTYFFKAIALCLFLQAVNHLFKVPDLALMERLFVSAYTLAGLYKAIKLWNIVYFINNEQIKIRTGIFSFHTNYLELFRIKDYIVAQPFFLRIFGLMNFTILSIDRNTGNERLTIYGIRESKLPEHLRNLVQQARQKNRVYEIDGGKL